MLAAPYLWTMITAVSAISTHRHLRSVLYRLWWPCCAADHNCWIWLYSCWSISMDATGNRNDIIWHSDSFLVGWKLKCIYVATMLQCCYSF